MAYYYKICESEDHADVSDYNGFQLYKAVKASEITESSANYDFSKYVLIELLDNVTPESKLWKELGLANNRKVTHKRMMVDSHRINCRRAIVICVSSEEAKSIASRLSQARIMNRSVCAVVIQELLSDLRLFEKQILQYGDKKPQYQLLYVTDLNKCRTPAGLVKFLREKFSAFGTILSVLVCEDADGYAYPEGVIKFSYLSEAFAAELAYDQCVVGKERLSVTAHHNILLSQCDLRLRLREAHFMQKENSCKSFISVSERTPEYSLCNSSNSSIYSISNGFKSALAHSKSKSCQSGNMSEVLHQNVSEDSAGSTTSDCNNIEITYDSSDLEVIQTPNQTNFVDCLKSIAAFKDSSVSSNISDDVMSVSSVESAAVKTNSDMNFTSHTCLNSVDMSETIALCPQNITSCNDGQLSLDTDNLTDTAKFSVLNGSQNLNHQGSNIGKSQLAKTVSQADKCLIYGNSVLNSSCDSVSSNEKTLIGKINFDENDASPSKEENSSVTSLHSSDLKQNIKSDLHESAELNKKDPQQPVKAISILSSSSSSYCEEISDCGFSKRKKTSKVSQKLSLKSKRLDGCKSASQKTVSSALSVYSVDDQQMSEQLNTFNAQTGSTRSVNGSIKNASSLSVKPSSRINEWLSQLPNSSDVSRVQQISINKTSNSMNNTSVGKNCRSVQLDSKCKSVQSSVRRSSRFASCKKATLISNDDNQSNVKSKSGEYVSENSKNNSIDLHMPLRNTNADEDLSPLKSWLRRELFVSTNNLVTRPQEGIKSIVCAAINKDILISVGCSHMTCEFCYPDSINLLLGLE
ncbi:uncharacterized protein LOC118181578 [Stegodyphus dumicola]|uniref:uncharacterized protein LOC118181578 n=1 Tax=Stegodyphus dumicola TaxID=202533 RepID=UPI0015AE4B6A|nr:uncharacterized protein LOC118181578 [Stegodyphus dumicola]